MQHLILSPLTIDLLMNSFRQIVLAKNALIGSFIGIVAYI